MTATDALFVYADSPVAPMNMGSVQILKVPAARRKRFFEDFREFLAGRIQYLPKLTMRLVVDRLGLPHWQPCENFDLDDHLRRTRVRSEEDRALFEKIGRLQHTPLDLDKPPFMFYVIEGLRDGRVAIVQKYHHAFADGKTAVRMMDLFSDEGLERSRRDADELKDEDNPGWLLRSLSGTVEDVRRTVGSLPGIAGAARKMFGPGGKEMLERMQSRPVTIFNQPISHDRLFAFRNWPMEEMTQLRRAAGLTFVDFGMALLGGALRRYMDELDVLPEQSLVCNVPVALDVKGGGEGGNAVLAIWVPLGTHLADPRERIEYMKAEADACKSFLSGVLEGADVGQGIQLPSFFMKPMAKQMSSEWMMKRNPPPGNVALSSVPSPAEPIHVAGALVESLYGMPMLFQAQAVSTTFSSYAGQVVMSILCCARALPEPERIFDYMEDEFRVLREVYS
jgi:WS/DGAT/MGAT family acyltransferase